MKFSKRIKRLLRFGGKAAVILVLLPVAFVGAVYFGAFGHLPDQHELLDIHNQTASLVYSADDRLLGRFFVENRTNVRYDDLPTALVQALIATEDARYFEHNGVDTRSLARVFFKTLLARNASSGGGSTISQQLAKNLFGRTDIGLLSMPVAKTKEAILAMRLEKLYDKNELLTLYLNTVPFGEDVFGIETASRRYFNCGVSDLKTEQAAVLVGLLKANTAYNPRLHPQNAKGRRNVVLKQMGRYGYLTIAVVDSLQGRPLGLNYDNIEKNRPAAYFMDRVQERTETILGELGAHSSASWNIETDGLIIKTTLNAELQSYARAAYAAHLPPMQKKLDLQYERPALKSKLEKYARSRLIREHNLSTELQSASQISAELDAKALRLQYGWDGYHSDSISLTDSMASELRLLHAGLLGMDASSGAIRIWVGGIDHQSHPYDQILAQRQLASAFKPILYAAALESGFSPCDYLNNEPPNLVNFAGWHPSNYDGSSGGRYSLRASLVHSMNLPTIDLLSRLGYDSLEKSWNNLGFHTDLPREPSVALGAVEASVYELCRAYASFANGGYAVEPFLITSIETADGQVLYEHSEVEKNGRIWSQRTSQLISGILQSAVDEGTGQSIRSVYGLNEPLAGKTGTSQQYGDAWFACFNPKLVMVARVGASTPSVHFNAGYLGSGSALALPLAGRTWRAAEKSLQLRQGYFENFTPLPDSLAMELQCPDKEELSGWQLFWQIFRNNPEISGQLSKEDENKKAKTGAIEKRRASKQKHSKSSKDKVHKKKKKGLFNKLFGKD